MDFDFSDEENNNNENKMSLSEYLANQLKEHEPKDQHGLKLRRFSLVQSTMGDRGYYILVNIFANEVQSDSVKTFYVFEGINVFGEEVEGNSIKEESMVTVLKRLKDNVQKLFYYEQEEFGEQPYRITEIDLETIMASPIISGTTWMSRFDENDKTVVEDKINTKIELLQNKEGKTPAPSPKRQRKKLYESDLKF